MRIREEDVKVLFFCEEKTETDILIDKMKELNKFRDDLIVCQTEWFEARCGNDIFCVVLAHTDGADILQLQLYKEMEIG
ncbi:hypothetical protein OAR07_01100 [Flavobacteriaceae bacterium]|nr:hypothetical protein [Flavobacteriaceae bacterium]